ncbi:MAG: sulfur reduction protein DsrS [Gammaproteobacteria bacterium]|nr:sulfur reduction protein DsrS [Gammaproteobacteria bacterium]
MQLSSEDSLRLNVLITQAEAIRIDENEMIVYGLMGDQEMRVALNPTMRADKYITQVRELLASVVLDSPGGYPIFLRRWTRMGQIDSDQLERLLRIGEPEAVMAVVGAPGLTNELARRAWWIAPYSEYARQMLENPTIVASEMGPVLAEHLVEHLPFETEHSDMLHTVRLVLQPGLINDEQRQRLWDRGQSKSTYRVGFLVTLPEGLLESDEARNDFTDISVKLQPLIEAGNPYARQLIKMLSSDGQTFCRVVSESMHRPADQNVVSALFDAIGAHFGSLRIHNKQLRTVEEIDAVVEGMIAQPAEALKNLLDAAPELEPEVRAMLFLAHFDESVVLPIFSMSDAVGTVMRKKISHVSEPMLLHINRLLGLDAQVATSGRSRRRSRSRD